MEQSKTPNKTQAAPEQYECLLVESFISFVFISLLLFSLSGCYLCSRYWAMHWGCVELIRTVIDGRVDDLSFRLNTRLDICLLAAFACFPPIYGNLSPYSLCHWEDTKKKRKKEKAAQGKIPRNKNSKHIMMKHFHSDNSTKCKNSHNADFSLRLPSP